jgi:hypothetical protein
MCGLRTGGWSLPGVMSDSQRCGDWCRVRLYWCWCRVKNKCERSLSVRPLVVEKTSRLVSRDPVANGLKCGPHGGKNGKMNS